VDESVLQQIARENREAEERAATAVPDTCPLDGTALEVRGGVRNCPMGNYRWDGEGRVLDGPGVETFEVLQ